MIESTIYYKHHIKKLQLSNKQTKTSAKVVSKNVSQCYHKIRKSESMKAMQTFLRIKVILCDFINFCIINILQKLYQNWLINECARKNIAK